MTELDRLDSIILETAQPEWRKQAFVISVVCLNFKTNEAAVATRIANLVATGMLESQGDLTQWRSSEVRLAGG